MTKLTEEQKAANKVAQNARDRAYNARKREYRAAQDAAGVTFQTHPLKVTADRADEAARNAQTAVEREEAELRAQIAQIEAQISGLREKAGINGLFQTRRDAYGASHSARTAMAAAVDAQYADVSGCYSAVTWAANGHWPTKA